MGSARIEAVVPVLAVGDMVRSLRFYTEGLGFQVRFQYSPEAPQYAGVERGAVLLHLALRPAEQSEGEEGPGYRFLVDDLGLLREELESKGVISPDHPVRETAWGTRELNLEDPDDNGLTFYQRL